jgi:hypothetical protein
MTPWSLTHGEFQPDPANTAVYAERGYLPLGVLLNSPGSQARRMTRRDMTVPSSFASQRTEAEISPNAKAMTRRRRSRTRSRSWVPNCSQRSIRHS